VLVSWCAEAGEAAPGAPPAPPSSGILRWLAENPFSATILFLVLATLIGMLVSRMVRDRCLKEFEGYPVTLELKDGRVYHGELDVERSGLEFLYERTTPQEGLRKTSFLIFQPEYATVHALLRYHDRLSEVQMQARARAARRAYHPHLVRRSWRAVRNFLAGVKDALLEAFGLFLGRMKGIQAAAPVMKSGGSYIDRVGKQTIGTAADITYDPLLEKQIGLRVILQLPQDAAVQSECVGTFREYTKGFFALMDVDYRSQWDVVLPGPGLAAFVRGIAAQRTPGGVHVENCSTFDVELAAVAIGVPEGGEALPPPIHVPVTLPSGDRLEFALASGAGAATLTFASQRKADLVVPRTGAFIRHKSEWATPRKLVGTLQEAVGLLPSADRVLSILKQGAELVSSGPRKNLVPFVKMHGCGNDYLYIDCRERVLDDPAALSRRLSDRHFGIGSDGLILILPSERADYRMRMFNADGSEAEMCGNGIRCFAKYLYDRDLLAGEEARIETAAGVLRVQIFPEGGQAAKVRVNMGAPRLERADIPMEGPPGRVVDEELGIEVPHEGNVTLRITCVSMGNPHAIAYVEDIETYPVEVYGPIVENHRLFPRRTNVEFVQVLGRNEAKMRVWERGSGETLACGTGASAVAVAGVLNGKTDRQAVVHVLGGDLELEWADDGCVYLTGPALEVFEGVVEV
jgi:diaminopimelate epimerase